MEFFSGAAAAILEKTAETTLLSETTILSEAAKESIVEWNLGSLEVQPDTITKLDGILEEDKYRKLYELKEVSRQNPELLPAYMNNIHVKGQMGEAYVEANLSRVGEVENQVRVHLSGSETGNIIDVRLKEAASNVKQVELVQNQGEIYLDSNYDVLKGESASYEVKNGGFPYLRQEIVNGDLLQQVRAGKDISDHSFVVINETTANELLRNPYGTDIIKKINEAGGKLIVGLPPEHAQMALFLG